MDHLTPEDLARLVDEPADPTEVRHLAECQRCADELDGLREQTTALRRLPDLTVPSGLFSSVEDALEREGLLAGRGRARGEGIPWLRIAAGFALFLLGSAAGTFVIAPAAAPERYADTPVTEAAGLIDAAASLRSAEAEYIRAVTRYAELSGSDEAVDPLNRLVALEGIVVTTEAALREAPADPIINNFHLTAVGQRDALLRQLELASAGDEWF